MSEESKTENAEFLVESINAFDLRLETALPSDSAPNEPDMDFGWDWRLHDPPDLSVFNVVVLMRMSPAKNRPEAVRAGIVGRFRMANGSKSELLSFVSTAAPSILYPFARQAISDLTTRGLHGTFLPPLTNIRLLMTRMHPELATGYKQLQSGEPAKVAGATPKTRRPRAKAKRRTR